MGEPARARTQPDDRSEARQRSRTAPPVAPVPIPARTPFDLIARRAGNGAVAREAQLRFTSGLRRALAAPSTAAGQRLLQREFGDDFDWAGAGSMTRSGEGAEGVLFVTSAAGRIVVKFLKAAAGASQADKTLGAVGVEVPDSRVVPNDDTDPLASQIRATIRGKLNTLEAVKQAQVSNQLNTYGYIQLQEMVQAVPLDKLDAKQIKGFLADPTLLQEVGKIAAVDSFLGNTDRLSAKLVNTGNYMLAGGAAGPTLIAIDNEMHAGAAGDKRAREGEVRFVLSPAGADAMALSFLSRLTGNFTRFQPSNEDIQTVQDNIKLGIKAGAEAVIDLMQSQPGFIDDAKKMETDELPGPQGTDHKHRELVRKTMNARLEAIKESYRSGGWKDLV